MSEPKITFCIFSFNRGNFLKNCVDSIAACTPDSEIIIFDDDSTDPDTQAYLQEVASFCRVVGAEKKGGLRHGGLYHNMNVALQECRDKPLVCFLQDDTQVVRPLSSGEISMMAELFEHNSDIGFLHPCFIRGSGLRKRPVTPVAGPEPELFYRGDAGQSAGVHYSDLSVFKPSKLLAAGWQFRQSEPENDRQARRLFGMMVYMWLPFAMWLPEVPAYRGKHKTLGLKLAERRKQVGFFPFKIWSADRVRDARAQSGEKPPIAEDWLECEPHSPPKPWTYNPLTGLRFYKHLNTIEMVLRRWFSRNVR